MSETKEFLDKLNQVGEAIKHVQEKQDQYEKDRVGCDLENIKKIAEEAAKGLEEAQEKKLKDLSAAYHERIGDLEAEIARKGGGETKNDPEFRQAMARYLRKGVPIDNEVVLRACDAHIERALIGASDVDAEIYKKDLVAGSGPDGGYFLQTDRSEQISRRIFETSPLRSVANIVTTNSDVFEIILDDDEADAGWIGEVSSRPDTDTPQIGVVKIPVHELYAQPRVTQKMIDDAGFDIEGWLAGKVERKLGRMENTSFVSGDGSQKPKGFLSYAAWASTGVYERNKVEQITATGTAGSLTNGDDIIILENSLIEDYQMNAVWGMQRSTFTDVMTLKTTAGEYLMNPNSLIAGNEKVLRGKPVVFMSDMPTVAANALAVVIADFKEFYTVVDRFGIRVLRDPYTSKPYVRFYTTKRVGGAVTNFEAGKILKINA